MAKICPGSGEVAVESKAANASERNACCPVCNIGFYLTRVGDRVPHHQKGA